MESIIRFLDKELKESFESLKEEDERLYKEIVRALESIRNNAFYGRNVKKELIPKEFKQKYGVDNLWIYNLRKDWRLLYSLANKEIEVIAIVLDWMDHKDYEKLFRF